MQEEFDINKFRGKQYSSNQYQKQLIRLADRKIKTDKIEATVKRVAENLQENSPSFIIYGEPQSGKTEMMICLAAKLLDNGYELIVILLNDSVDLLSQNLGRFRDSGLAPSPQNFSHILDPDYKIKGIRHVVFCKKNCQDLEKLTDKIDATRQVIVIDDEADHATPNAKINQNNQTAINKRIEKLLRSNGRYIGVTATPARLDLNNTFNNDNTKWVDFATHESYTGQNHFFPVDDVTPLYRLSILPGGDEPKHLRKGLLSFLVATAYLNLDKQDHEMTRYSMLVHTSGKTDDHKKDEKRIRKVFENLTRLDSSYYEQYVNEIWNISQKRYPDENADEITKFVLRNIQCHGIIVLNSKRDVSSDRGEGATNPKALFTIVIGGNIVSRGVTLNNLLSMYFTRNVKSKIQQDTYIQRARMFGCRSEYLKHFELSIPGDLYSDWHRCFVYHKLSLDGMRRGNLPIWITDQRVSVVASSSIDKRNVYQTHESVLSFALFDYSVAQNLEAMDGSIWKFEKLKELHGRLGEAAFPKYLMDFIENFDGGSGKIACYEPKDISSVEPDLTRGDDIENVYRSRGFWGHFDRDSNKEAVHHFTIFHYNNEKGRLFYKYNCGDIRNLKFLKNMKNA